MRTSIDSTMLFDVFLPDPVFEERSRDAIEKAAHGGGLVLAEPAYAELAAFFPSAAELDRVLDALEIMVEAVSREGAFVPGRAGKKYREAGGRRTRMMSDFLIGGHALTQAGQLLSRDRGFYLKYFSGLTVIDPSKA